MFQCFPMINVKKSLNLKSNINNVIGYNPCCLSFIFLGRMDLIWDTLSRFFFFYFFLEALKRRVVEPKRGGLLRDHVISGMSKL